jgi:DNA polymerase-3 subunit epsilon
MSVYSKNFNSHAGAGREIVLDIETTGLFTADGHRVIEVGAVEMINGVATGIEFYALVNPARDIPAEVSRIHGITDERVKDQPGFETIARQLRDFIGDATIVITCRTKEDGYTLDRAFIDMEFARAGVDTVPEDQWLNVRRWSEQMFGPANATLDKVLDRYKISRVVRDENGHGAILDARLLSEVYPLLRQDFLRQTPPQQATPRHPKP